MKFSCNTSEFLQALQLVSRAIGSQQALPILGNILFEAKGISCTVSATDLEVSIITSFAATIEEEGSITIPAKAILNFAQYNNDTEVTLETHEGTQLKCTSKHAKTMIAGEAASEYPTITAVEKLSSFVLQGDPLLRALHLVTFASAKTTLRPVLSGVYLRREAGDLVLVATDSYRLSEYRIPVDGTEGEMSCIIPAKILEEVKVILSSRKGDKKPKEKPEGDANPQWSGGAEITLSKQQVEIRIGSTRLLSRLIDGKFPNYQQIIPKESVTKVQFGVAELLTVTKRMHYFAKEMNNNLTFHCAPEQTRIATPQTSIGKDEATIQAEATGGENKIALSSSYLLDFLNHIDCDTIEMQMSDSQHPAVFIMPGQEKYLHLIMPLRMQEE
jgi:DNA polymerase-3 subunit beta